MRIVPKGAAKHRGLSVKAGARRALTIGGTLVGAATVVTAFSMPAGATLTVPANNTIIGSGSSTTYSMMQQLDNLFNASPGCQQFVPFPTESTPQPLDYSCTTPPTPAANPENPYNDLAAEEAALGSSNGIQQLEDQGAHGAGANTDGTPINVANNQNYARSSRALKSTDLKGLNFVAYAEDGVSWFHYTKTGGAKGAATPSADLNNLTTPQLTSLWNGTYTNWDQVCNDGAVAGSEGAVCGTNAPIVVFSAQEGSGTQSTWKTFIGIDPSASTNPVNCFIPKGGSNSCVGPAVIFENEDAQISTTAFTAGQSTFTGKTNPDWKGKAATPTQIKADAVFFFSTGKYNLSCEVNKGAACGGSPLGGNTNAVPSINGVAPTEATILDGQFPDTRYLYNIYSNGSNTNIPAASAATLNYVSEIGFLCNPNKGSGTNVLDPNTGTAYINEIQSTIEAAGFYPLSAGAAEGGVNQSPIDEGPLTNPASALLSQTTGGQGTGQPTSDPGYAQYQPYDLFATTGDFADPSGYCLASDTDGNASS